MFLFIRNCRILMQTTHVPGKNRYTNEQRWLYNTWQHCQIHLNQIHLHILVYVGYFCWWFAPPSQHVKTESMECKVYNDSKKKYRTSFCESHECVYPCEWWPETLSWTQINLCSINEQLLTVHFIPTETL